MTITLFQRILANSLSADGYAVWQSFFGIRSPENKRLKVFERDNYTCVFCGKKVTDVYPLGQRGFQFVGDGVLFNLDHIIPRSKGGLTIVRNLQCTCEPCNQKKGASYDAATQDGLSPHKKRVLLRGRRTDKVKWHFFADNEWETLCAVLQESVTDLLAKFLEVKAKWNDTHRSIGVLYEHGNHERYVFVGKPRKT